MKYVIKRIFKMDFKNFFNKIDKMHEETHKSKIWLFFDVLFTCLRFKAGYMDYYLLKMYEMTTKEKSTYLVRGINNELVEKLNDKKDISLLNNKIKTNKLLNDYLKRDWTSLDDKKFDTFIKKHPKFIAKPSNGQCGKGIEVLNAKDFKNIKDLKSYLQKNNLYLLEELISQHKVMANINDSSVNTIRIVSIYNEKVFFIGACIRFGNKNVVDNFESGGMTAKVDVDTGVVLSPAIDKKGDLYYEHPVSKAKIQGFKIPYYEETLKMIDEMAAKVPTIRYVGWDISITDKGPVLVEANPLPGSQITQMPYPGGKKEGCLPKITEAMNYKN